MKHLANPSWSSPASAPLAAGMLALLLLVPLPVVSRMGGAVVDLMHAPAFALLAVLSFRSLRHWLPRNPLLAGISIGALATGFGGLMEWGQHLVGRGASFQDAQANAWGAAGGVLYALARRRASAAGTEHFASRRFTATAWQRRMAIVAAFALVLVGLLAPLRVLADCYLQWRALPLVASFEHPWEMARFGAGGAHLARSPRYATHGQWSLEVQLTGRRYPGFQMNWPPNDWSAYGELAMDITLTGETPLPLVIKIHDLAHWDYGRAYNDRYHRRVLLQPGRNQVGIDLIGVENAPRTRPMNMRQICFVQFFVLELDKPRTLYFDNLRLH